jgi:hypothetical protein
MNPAFLKEGLPILIFWGIAIIVFIVGLVKIKKSMNSSRSSASRTSSDYDDGYRSVIEANLRDLKRDRKIIENKIQESIENGGKLGNFTTEDYRKQLEKNTREIKDMERNL